MIGFLAYLTVAGWALSAIANRTHFLLYSSKDFFQPEAVRALAASLPASTEDEFILAAWQWVGTSIVYEQLGSDMYFVDGIIQCEDCFLPSQVLLTGEGNCVAKSALLASILATRIPLERIRIIIGNYAGIGGHAWVEIERTGIWYLLESTASPNISAPWIITELATKYSLSVIITYNDIICQDLDFCASLAGCNCSKIKEEWQWLSQSKSWIA